MEVDSRGFKIHYLAAGDGPPLLLIPGSLQSAGRWRCLRYFDSLVAVLDRDEAERVHVWGYGRGAHHAFLLARLHPQRVLSLTAGGYSPSAAPGRRGHLLLVASALRSGDLDRALDLLGVTELGNRAVLMDNDAAAEAAAVEMTFMEPVELIQVHAPAFLYAGSEEPFVD